MPSVGTVSVWTTPSFLGGHTSVGDWMAQYGGFGCLIYALKGLAEA
jgi:hypothetical protein